MRPNCRILLGRLWHCWLRFSGRRVVYIDCGANVGAVLEEEVRKYPVREYFAFEPNADLIGHLRAIKNRYPRTSIEIFNKAVWIEESTVDFFLSRENSHGELVTDGSTLLHGKAPVHPLSGRIDYDHPVQTQAVDFSQWILNTFRQQDHLCMKMDIEGAEYAVLAKMMADKSISCVKKAFVEFHYREDRQLRGISHETHETVCRRVGEATKLTLWN